MNVVLPCRAEREWRKFERAVARKRGQGLGKVVPLGEFLGTVVVGPQRGAVDMQSGESLKRRAGA